MVDFKWSTKYKNGHNDFTHPLKPNQNDFPLFVKYDHDKCRTAKAALLVARYS